MEAVEQELRNFLTLNFDITINYMIVHEITIYLS